MSDIRQMSIGLVVAAAALVGMYFLLPDSEPEPASIPPRTASAEAPERTAKARVSPPPPPTPSGESVARGGPRPPVDQGEAWREKRIEMQARWRDRSIAVAEQFAAEKELPEATCAELLAALVDMHEQFAAVRARMEDRSLSREAAVAELSAIRDVTRARMVATLGEEQTDALQAKMAELRGGGF